MDVTAEARRAWHLIESGNPLLAAEIYEQIVIQHPTMGMWNCYGIALHEAGLYERAEAAFRTIRTLPHPVGYTTINAGAAIWCQGRYEDAYDDWLGEINRLMSGRIKTWESSGVFLVCMLWWAAQRLNRPELWAKLQPLAKKVVKLRGQQVPLAMAYYSFITGTLTSDRLLDYAAADVFDRDLLQNFAVKSAFKPDFQYDVSRSMDLCNTWFYLSGKEVPGSHEWAECLRTMFRYAVPLSVGDPEYFIAKYELRKYSEKPA